MDGVMEGRKDGGMNPFLPDAGIRGLVSDLSILLLELPHLTEPLSFPEAVPVTRPSAAPGP